MSPLTPAVPAFAVAIVTPPEEVTEPTPLVIVTAPPRAASPMPAEIDTSPPAPAVVL
eukprot:CAMPEP_0203001036 /NCGR_PEP_ID=MMETSP1401-20130829/286_1 /ASSEMBLY_ACC=CAM_ASM_000894 /TAXON_ID=38833 /ORGANISM="Micromonas pusilla, Strain CCAC1681" /LENGTH=56 /DNA_ID=CAMNT_0049742489 /DNA_START=21 /DNA_END=187 /DNA_ORIENTATION=-